MHLARNVDCDVILTVRGEGVGPTQPFQATGSSRADLLIDRCVRDELERVLDALTPQLEPPDPPPLVRSSAACQVPAYAE
jgi:hypothetical protein